MIKNCRSREVVEVFHWTGVLDCPEETLTEWFNLWKVQGETLLLRNVYSKYSRKVTPDTYIIWAIFEGERYLEFFTEEQFMKLYELVS